MTVADKMLKSKHKKTKQKKSTKAIKAGELSMDLSEPIKAARVDWVLELYGSLLSRVTIIRRVMAGRPADFKKGTEAIPGVSNAEAYRFFRLALRVADQEMAEARQAKIRWHRSQLIGLAKQARSLKQPGTAAVILQRVETFDGIASAGQPDPGDRRPDELSDEALAQRIAEELAKKNKKPDAAA